MTKDTVFRSLHDLGLAAWFGSSLAAAATPAAAGSSSDDREPPTAATLTAVAIGVHAVGGIGLIVANRDRHRRQRGVLTVTLVKAAVTGAAIAATAYSARVTSQLAQADADGAGAPTREHEEGTSRLRAQARTLALTVPVLTGALVVLGAEEGELQRPAEVARGVTQSAATRIGDGITGAAAHARDVVVDRIHDIDTGRIGEAVSELRDAVVERVPDEWPESAASLRDAVVQGTESVRETVANSVGR
jgi:hypothetical protein